MTVLTPEEEHARAKRNVIAEMEKKAKAQEQPKPPEKPKKEK